MEVSYDEKADVLYITLKECKDTKNSHEEDGVIVSKDAETGEVVGYTIMYFSDKEKIDLPLGDEIDSSAIA